MIAAEIRSQSFQRLLLDLTREGQHQGENHARTVQQRLRQRQGPDWRSPGSLWPDIARG